MLQTLRDGERLVRTLSYAELHSRVSTLATTLRESGLEGWRCAVHPLAPGKGFRHAVRRPCASARTVSVLMHARRALRGEPTSCSGTGLHRHTERLYARLCLQVPAAAAHPGQPRPRRGSRCAVPRPTIASRLHARQLGLAVCSPLRDPTDAVTLLDAQQAYGRGAARCALRALAEARRWPARAAARLRSGAVLPQPDPFLTLLSPGPPSVKPGAQ